jgi:hypothetical protein
MAGKRPKRGQTSNGAARRNGPARQGTYFLSLSLENVRCFGEKQVLDLSDSEGRPARWTILLGNNGTGKTTVLQALAAFVPMQGAVKGKTTWAFQGVFWVGDLARDLARSGCEKGGSLSAEILPHSSFGAGATSGTPVRYRFLPGTFGPPEPSPNDPQPPICYGYGAGRRLGTRGLGEGEEGPTASLFSDSGHLRNAEDWLLRLDYSATKPSRAQGRQKHLQALVHRLLVEALPEVEGIRACVGEGGYPTAHVEFHTPYGWVRLRQLGYGYQTLIAWMVDLASRLIERYPDSDNPLAEPAVVLVDEIDLHLHPQWQRKLIGYLTEQFPGTQFIVTAHSPLVVQAAPGANLAVLRREGDHVVIDNDPGVIRGWRIDQIYTSDLFGLPTARPPELDEPLRRRRELLSQAKMSVAEERELKELEERIGNLPGGETPEQIRALRLIEESEKLLAGLPTPQP